jgi:hypothetical protein
VIAGLEVRVGARREREQAYTTAEERVPASEHAARKGLERGEQRGRRGEERGVGRRERALRVGVGEERAEVVDGTDKVVEVAALELLDLDHSFACRGTKRGEQQLGRPQANARRTKGPMSSPRDGYGELREAASDCAEADEPYVSAPLRTGRRCAASRSEVLGAACRVCAEIKKKLGD